MSIIILCLTNDKLDTLKKQYLIESNHWILDVLFKEDDSRINRQNRPQNLSVVRKLALNLLKRYKQSAGVKKTLTKLQIDCLVNPDFLKTILTYL